ncbi:MAG: hypothetical protein JO102_01670 [Elusimicrobia bacterium]|nr:hypothetical protein [Elusimicrobiota bacterium]
MAEEARQIDDPGLHPLASLLKEVDDAVRVFRATASADDRSIMDLRWQFDQISAKMNQAIYNDQQDLIHDSTLKTIAVLFEILARS